jgi:methylmalonyl-CoA mutase N-terminal domain/subunit
VADTADPLGGSYYVEALTDRVEAEARAYIEQIDAMGGALKAIERSFQQREIHENAYRIQREVEEGRRTVVGVNAFAEEEKPAVSILRVDEAAEQRQAEKVRALRSRRDPGPVESALARIEEAARSSDNLMPLLIDAVEKYATLGEICGRLRAVWGEQGDFGSEV